VMTRIPGHLSVSVSVVSAPYWLMVGRLGDVPEGYFPRWRRRLDIWLPVGYPAVRERSASPEAPASVPVIGPDDRGNALGSLPFAHGIGRSSGLYVVLFRGCATGYGVGTRRWITACSPFCVCDALCTETGSALHPDVGSGCFETGHPGYNGPGRWQRQPHGYKARRCGYSI